MREGDALVVTKLDRLARSVAHLAEIVAGLENRKIGLKILDLGLDTTTATGRLMLNVLGSVAEFERAMMLERQREGIAKAKAQGKYAGRAPTVARQADRNQRNGRSGYDSEGYRRSSGGVGKERVPCAEGGGSPDPETD